MIRNLLIGAAVFALAACGDGNPFDSGGTTGGATGSGGIVPADVAKSVTTFTYDPAAGTLSVSGPLRDGDEIPTEMIRKPGLDQGVYEAYTFQDDPLDEHVTAYVRTVGPVSGVVALTGGQFTYYSGGVGYARSGGFDPAPVSERDDTGLVSYAGEYIGLSNLNGPDTDLLPLPIGIPDAIRPSQASIVNGAVFINVGFDDMNVAGVIYDRQINSDAFGVVGLPDLILVPGELADDGTFAGTVELPGTRQEVGDYAGIIGGTDASALAGGIFVDEHFDSAITVNGEEESGVFVLGRCGGPLEDPSAECALVDPL